MVSQGRRAWLAAHKQALAYALVALSMAVTVGSATVGGFYLHHAADLERQTLRTQRLGGAAFRLQDFLSRAQAEQGVSAELARERGRRSPRFICVPADSKARPGRGQPHPACLCRVRARIETCLRPGDEKSRPGPRLSTTAGRAPACPPRVPRRRRDRQPGSCDPRDESRREARVDHRGCCLPRSSSVSSSGSSRCSGGAGRIDRDNAARAEELIRLRDEFVATVSHELRTPLTSILGYLELIGDDDSGDRHTGATGVPRDRAAERRTARESRE